MEVEEEEEEEEEKKGVVLYYSKCENFVWVLFLCVHCI